MVVMQSGTAQTGGACACHCLPPVPALVQAGLLAQPRLLLPAKAASASGLVAVSGDHPGSLGAQTCNAWRKARSSSFSGLVTADAAAVHCQVW